MSIVEKALGKARAPSLREAVRPASRGSIQHTAVGTNDVARVPARHVAMQALRTEAIGAFWADQVEAPISNHLRGLRRELLAQLQPVIDSGVTPLVLVTSPLPGDGKTFVSAAIARTFAKAPDMHVTLVDLDLVRHSCSSQFGAADLPGLMESLHGGSPLEEVTCATDVPQLNLIPAGIERREAFVGDLLGSLFDQLRHLGPGSLCFLDAPPVLPVVETALLASKVDLVLLVVRAGETPQAAVFDSLARLGPQAKVCIALNSVVHAHTSEYYDYSQYDIADRGSRNL
jgi:Mrp family chromosome partitioning ATPase